MKKVEIITSVICCVYTVKCKLGYEITAEVKVEVKEG